MEQLHGKEPNNMNIDNMNNKMSNFEVLELVRNGTSIDTIRVECGWKTYEVKERITAAREGVEWLPGMKPKTPEELLEERYEMEINRLEYEYKSKSKLATKARARTKKKIARTMRGIKRKMGSPRFKNLFSLKKSNAHATHAIGTDKGIKYLERYNISGKRNNTSGIDISLDNGNTIAVRASGDEPGSVFLIQGELTNLVSSHIMIIRNMNDEEPSFYVLDTATAIDLSSESYYAEDGTGSWFIYPKDYMIFENNIKEMEG
jgi:hypothetical protein